MAVPAYIKKYLRIKPEVHEIFDDLDEFRDFVRMQNPAVKFDEANMYRSSSPIWQKFLRRQVNGQPADAPKHNPYRRATRK